MPYMPEILQELNRLDAPPSENPLCHTCNSPAEYRCLACFSEGMYASVAYFRTTRRSLSTKFRYGFSTRHQPLILMPFRNGMATPSKILPLLPPASLFRLETTSVARVLPHPPSRILWFSTRPALTASLSATVIVMGPLPEAPNFSAPNGFLQRSTTLQRCSLLASSTSSVRSKVGTRVITTLSYYYSVRE